MNTHSRNGTQNRQASPEDRFDAAMRELHRAALTQLSPQVRRRLGPATESQERIGGRFGHWHRGPLLAGFGTAMLAIALGVGLWPRHEQAVPAAPTTVGGPVAAPADDPASLLGQDPDFYAWLASDDAELMAME